MMNSLFFVERIIGYQPGEPVTSGFTMLLAVDGHFEPLHDADRPSFVDLVMSCMPARTAPN